MKDSGELLERIDELVYPVRLHDAPVVNSNIWAEHEFASYYHRLWTSVISRINAVRANKYDATRLIDIGSEDMMGKTLSRVAAKLAVASVMAERFGYLLPLRQENMWHDFQNGYPTTTVTVIDGDIALLCKTSLCIYGNEIPVEVKRHFENVAPISTLVQSSADSYQTYDAKRYSIIALRLVDDLSSLRVDPSEKIEKWTLRRMHEMATAYKKWRYNR